jgi:hypothetical protein
VAAGLARRAATETKSGRPDLNRANVDVDASSADPIVPAVPVPLRLGRIGRCIRYQAGTTIRGMAALDLVAREDRALSVVAAGSDKLWYQNGGVRGRW